jgi:hypothetical protein
MPSPSFTARISKTPARWLPPTMPSKATSCCHGAPVATTWRYASNGPSSRKAGTKSSSLWSTMSAIGIPLMRSSAGLA